jgi:hypothetical protein
MMCSFHGMISLQSFIYRYLTRTMANEKRIEGGRGRGRPSLLMDEALDLIMRQRPIIACKPE